MRFAPLAATALTTSVALADLTSRLQAELSAVPAGSIVTSLDFDAYGNFGATTTVPDSSSMEYADASSDAGPRAEVDTFATAAGAMSRVVTAVAWNGSAYQMMAFARTGDTTKYETSVVDADPSTLSTQAAALASNGYYITALGRSASGYVLIGTRKAGDTTARAALVTMCTEAFCSGDHDLANFAAGYVLVGYVYDAVAMSNVLVWEK